MWLLSPFVSVYRYLVFNFHSYVNFDLFANLHRSYSLVHVVNKYICHIHVKIHYLVVYQFNLVFVQFLFIYFVLVWMIYECRWSFTWNSEAKYYVNLFDVNYNPCFNPCDSHETNSHSSHLLSRLFVISWDDLRFVRHIKNTQLTHERTWF